MKNPLIKKIFLLLGPILALLVYGLMTSNGSDSLPSKAAALLVWMAVWWVSEAVNLYVTSLLPIIFLPLTGVMKMEDVAPNYMNEVIFLFIGGFLFAYALEKWNLHNRIALNIILKTGKTPSSVLFGVMFSAYFISMWINNTATTAMLIPAVLAISGQISKEDNEHGIAAPLLIGLAFSASIGGMATLIGTAPNMIFLKEYTAAFPDGTPISFASWMAFGVPVSFLLFLGCFYVLKWQYRKLFTSQNIDLSQCKKDLENLGPLRYEEKWMIFFFVLSFLGWFFLKEIKIGSLVIPSWTNIFSLPPKMVTESTVAMFIVFVLFFIPSKNKSDRLLTWKEVKKLPVGIIFLFGGGFALSKAVDVTELDLSMASLLSNWASISPWLLVLLLVIFMTVLSEFASNTASLQLVFPVLVTFVGHLNADPLVILIPVTLAASCGFMLPIATPPNTIVFGSEKISSSQMIRAGFWVDILGITIITLISMTLLQWMLG